MDHIFIASSLFKTPVVWVLGSSAVILLILISTWAITTLRFKRQLFIARLDNGEPAGSEPSTIPYAIPFLGSSLSFVKDQGPFLDYIRDLVGGSASMCTVRLGPVKSYIAVSASAVQAMFKNNKVLTSDKFERMILLHTLDMSLEDVDRFQEKSPDAVEGLQSIGKRDRKLRQDAIYQQYLLGQGAANQLTDTFIEFFKKELDALIPIKDSMTTVDLFQWLRQKMFKASVTALYGSVLQEVYPTISQDFWIFDNNFMRIIYGTPKFMAPNAYAAVKRLLDGKVKWSEEARLRSGGISDPVEGPDWEPNYGSRFQRAREQMYEEAGLSTRGRAGLNLGILFGLNTNAVPSTAWMMFHILASPDDLLPRVLAEVRTALNADGTIDVPTLITLPLLLSMYTETLRLFVAFNVTREIKADFSIDGYLLKKGAMIMAPTSLGHRDLAGWKNVNPDQPSLDTFYAERFLRQEGEKTVFSMAGLTGKYFPYGGGAHICPGRIFAKQEILGAVALLLLTFDFEFVEWVDPRARGKKTPHRFPKEMRNAVGVGVLSPDRDMRVRIRKR